jgi:hypothetical protein
LSDELRSQSAERKEGGVSHTPGPWVVEDSRKLPKRLRQNIIMVVAEKGGMPGLIVNQGAITKEDEANARLIAAAPDLLAALKRVLKAEDDYFYLTDDSHSRSEHIKELSAADEQARAAIKKAT